jgi:hypothetical protein
VAVISIEKCIKWCIKSFYLLHSSGYPKYCNRFS